MRALLKSLLLLTLMSPLTQAQCTQPSPWPTPTQQNKPWTRWWWLGSAVDNENLTALLTQYRDAGLGGVEICPIYGAKGAESRYLPFLSKEWTAALDHTLSESNRLGLGVDLTTGTGWPFGGPNVPREHASAKLILQPPSPDNATYTATAQPAIQKVKRAAPGGEGYVLDPYSVPAMEHYLKRFTDQLNTLPEGLRPRAHFHDSFEYYGANWTPTFLQEFKKLRGYDLEPELPALAGQGDKDHVARVKYDYRITLNDLHLAYIKKWSDWSHSQHGLSRNQAHGAPGNLIDLYAAADIPECEIFGPVTHPDNDAVMLKLASSAAHLTGKPLTSSESFTWLGEHFQTSLADCKPAADHLFLAGINHVFFHGTPYSPKDAGFPGWLFYASVHFGPQGGLYSALPAFNAYLTRIQSILQQGRPDNDVLIYFPVHDTFHTPEGLQVALTVHSQQKWLHPTPFYKLATDLTNKGYAWDAISDAILENATVKDGKIVLPARRVDDVADVGSASADGPSPSYSALVLPSFHYLPHTTAQKLGALANAGATILTHDHLPTDVPGLKDLEQRRQTLKQSLATFSPTPDIPAALAAKNIRREPMLDLGLHCIRRAREGSTDYFIVNRTGKPVDAWIPLATPAKSALLLDPRYPNRHAAPALRPHNNTTEIYLQLAPGESTILRTNLPSPHPWTYTRPTAPTPLEGTWQVIFTQGGPTLPKPYTTDTLASWTDQPDEEAKRFAGTARYTLTFNKPTAASPVYLLDLGKVADSARITLNGQDLATLFSPPFTAEIPAPLLQPTNTLEIHVTNLAANRIADLDRRKVQWKSFHEINFVNKDYKPFDASTWPLRPSGLLGPVTLTPITTFDPTKDSK